jgi:hypothetical protein
MALTPDRIQELLAKTRQKGIYTQKTTEFLSDGEMGVDVRERWPEFAKKPASTLKQGFDAVKDKKEAPEGAENIKVVKSEEDVYLINLAHPDVGQAPAEAELVEA